MKYSFLITLFIFPSILLIGQSDTAVVYFSKTHAETTKDSASSYAKFFKHDNFWYGRTYDIKSNVLKSEGKYVEKNYNKPVGSFKNYNDKGILDNIADYADDSKPIERTFFYKNGSKKSWISYRDKGANEQKGWDETGKEIKGFVVEREARFKGGPEGWRRFLEKNLNANVAADAGAPAGMYEVKVQFIVSKEGYVSNVKAVSIPPKCKPCAAEVINVITNGPAWEHAIQNNEPVIYQAIQHVTFQVAEETKRGRKS